ncbi:E3 ubiquitin-protein ligase TRIM35-like [Scomber japonicus]|uniref:E3 ubiquitin-protein ligase TRIM35-like n=1 Tax=Scomber japonicus TaxID=13676 RepID=UPI002306D9BB|nr:E3 ubiquitin-protein ligase TRIM35-like [Scomber japonicus]
MASETQANYSCPICYEIFSDPVILSCSHSFCRTCWRRCWAEDIKHHCPVCKTRCFESEPPRNLALKNLCEDFLAERAQRASAGAEPLCSLHAEKFKLFCLDDQQPLCVVCMHSEKHRNHSIKPIDEAARDYKHGLQDSLEALRKKLEPFNDVKREFDQTGNYTELQAQDTERQIKDVFSKLQQFLQREERVRVDKLREEKQMYCERLKLTKTTSNTQVAALSATITATEEALRSEDLRFLQNYKTTAERVNQPLPDAPEPIPALLDTAKHLNNLTSVVLDKMKKEIVTSNFKVLQPTTNTEPLGYGSRYRETTDYCNTFSNASRNRLSLAQPTRSETPGPHHGGYGLGNRLGRAVSTQRLNTPFDPEPAPGLLKKKTKSCWSLAET